MKYPKNVLQGNTLFSCLDTEKAGCPDIERSHEIFLYSHHPFHLCYTGILVYFLYLQIKKSIFKLNEQITTLGSLLFCFCSNVSLSLSWPFQSAFIVFFKLKFKCIWKILLYWFPLELCILCWRYFLISSCLGVQLNYSYYIHVWNTIKVSGLQFTVVVLYCTTFISELHYLL